MTHHNIRRHFDANEKILLLLLWNPSIQESKSHLLVKQKNYNLKTKKNRKKNYKSYEPNPDIRSGDNDVLRRYLGDIHFWDAFLYGT